MEIKCVQDGAVKLVWSPVNQAWVLTWKDILLGVFNSKQEAEAEFRRITS